MTVAVNDRSNQVDQPVSYGNFFSVFVHLPRQDRLGGTFRSQSHVVVVEFTQIDRLIRVDWRQSMAGLPRSWTNIYKLPPSLKRKRKKNAMDDLLTVNWPTTGCQEFRTVVPVPAIAPNCLLPQVDYKISGSTSSSPLSQFRCKCECSPSEMLLLHHLERLSFDYWIPLVHCLVICRSSARRDCFPTSLKSLNDDSIVGGWPSSSGLFVGHCNFEEGLYATLEEPLVDKIGSKGCRRHRTENCFQMDGFAKDWMRTRALFSEEHVPYAKWLRDDTSAECSASKTHGWCSTTLSDSLCAAVWLFIEFICGSALVVGKQICWEEGVCRN